MFPSATTKGSRVGTVVRVLASHQCGLGLILAIWVEFVVSSHLAPSVFLQLLFFLPPEKPTFLYANSANIIRVWLPSSFFFFFLFFFYYYFYLKKMMGTMH